MVENESLKIIDELEGLGRIDNSFNNKDSEFEESSNEYIEDSTESYEEIPDTDEIIHRGLLLKNHDNHYLLLRKIGFGNNANVWICFKISDQKYCAIKIQHYQCYGDGKREITILKSISDFIKINNEPTHCVEMIDYFVYQFTEEIKYICSVYELYGGSLHMLLTTGKYKYGLPVEIVKGLVFLHDELHIIHTDLKPDNLLIKGVVDSQKKTIEIFSKSGFIDKYNKIYAKYCTENSPDFEQFYQECSVLGMECTKDLHMIKDEIEYSSDEYSDESDDSDESIEEDENDFVNEASIEPYNKRRQSVDDTLQTLFNKKLVNLESKDTEDNYYDFESIKNRRDVTTDKVQIMDDKYVINCEIAITDFGNSYFYEKRTKDEIQARKYRAPEIIMDFNYSYSVDIWSLGCIVYELLTGYVLFDPEDSPLNKDIQHLYLMEKILGSIPLKYKKISKRSNFLFDSKRNYHVKNIEKIERISIKNILITQFKFDDIEANDCSNFISEMLNYNYKTRPSAIEILKHKWLN